MNFIVFFKYFMSDRHIIIFSVITFIGIIISAYQIYFLHINEGENGQMEKFVNSGHGLGFWMITSYAGLIVVHTIDLISLVCLKMAHIQWNLNDVFAVVLFCSTIFFMAFLGLLGFMLLILQKITYIQPWLLE